jgi:hypothetical protein
MEFVHFPFQGTLIMMKSLIAFGMICFTVAMTGMAHASLCWGG